MRASWDSQASDGFGRTAPLSLESGCARKRFRRQGLDVKRADTLPARLRRTGRTLGKWRPDQSWRRGALRSFLVSFLALTVILWLLPGQQVGRGAESVATLAVVALLVGALLRPLLIQLAALTGTIGLLLAGLLSQALILGVALQLVSTVRPFTLGEVVVAAWGTAVVSVGVNWLFDASSDETFFRQVLGQSVRITRRHGVAKPGLLVVQLDGVGVALMHQAITAGAMPTISRWLRSGSHDLRGWHTGLPATTPAGQAVLLHGDVTSIPAFRWYDKKAERVVQSSQPADLAETERGFSTGRGLLADGGISVSNLFSGDAPSRILTMSDARWPSSEPGAASFAVARSGLIRSFVLLAGQIVTELHQGRRQRRRGVLPRVRRGGVFVLLRGLTTVVLRDLNVSIVSEHMARSAPVIFVDFVDYDEVAHHAGPSRPEAMRTLESLDRVLQFFMQLAEKVRADFEIAVVSDHGQTQGTTFRQLAGHTLSDLIHQLASRPTASQHDDRSAEQWGPANVLLTGALTSDRFAVRTLRRVFNRRRRTATLDQQAARQRVLDELVITTSGSLAHVYLTNEPSRVTLEVVHKRFPDLVDGLTSNPYIGLVLVRRDDGALVALGLDGWRVLAGPGAGTWEGRDPVAPYGPDACDDLCGLDKRDHVGDLVVLGRYLPSLDEVVAFEELVGSHGGLGGGQTDALLIHPVEWSMPHSNRLSGVEVHAALIARLEQLGLRTAKGR